MSLKISDNISALRSEKEKLDSILRCMVEGLVVIDPKGKVLLVNEQAKTMFGVTEEQIRDGSFVEISRSPAMRSLLKEMLEFDFANNTYSKRVSVEDGRWFRVNAVSLRNGTERASGSILVFHDITQIERLETVRSDFVANVSHSAPYSAYRHSWLRRNSAATSSLRPRRRQPVLGHYRSPFGTVKPIDRRSPRPDPIWNPARGK